MSELEKAAVERIKQAQSERSQLADELSAFGRLRLLQERCNTVLAISANQAGHNKIWDVFDVLEINLNKVTYTNSIVATANTPLKAVEAAERALMANGANTDD